MMVKHGVPARTTRIETIAGWCLRYGKAFPITAGLEETEPVGAQWNTVYVGVKRLLGNSSIVKIIKGSYSRVFVDEYQDCTVVQHEIIRGIAEQIPTCVLGDPLQGIFRFAGGGLSWKRDVESVFPLLGELTTPWRWKERNEDLGEWLKGVRSALIRGESIDFSKGPIEWKESSFENQLGASLAALKKSGPVVVTRKWPRDAHAIARRLGGRFQSMEEIECKDLLAFAGSLDATKGRDRLKAVYGFCTECWTGIEGLVKGAEAREEVREAFKAVEVDESVGAVLAVMLIIESRSGDGIKLFRRELWNEAKRTLTQFRPGEAGTVAEAAWAIRNRARLVGRAREARCVSRTLLVKGLEFNHAVVLDADEFEDPKHAGDGARLLYVAVTRGSHSLSVLSKSPVVRLSVPQL
jgi:DNA helicase-2/ATP-dependent DNA helicase PcrA